MVHSELGVPQDCILGHFQPSLRDWVVSRTSTQDYVLGYSQPSLRDSIWREQSHAASAAQGNIIAFEDLLIGATALHLGFEIVTLNLQHFERMPGLKVVTL
jgi:predicted nucleic acid-binding protein